MQERFMVELSDVSPTGPADLGRLEAAWRLPVGAASPLWFIYAGAASAGVAYWWASRWTRPVNIEAMLVAAAPAAPASAEPVIEAAAVVEEALALASASEPIDEPLAEAAAEILLAEPAPVEVAPLEIAPVEVAAEDAASEELTAASGPETLPEVASEFAALAAAAPTPSPRKRARRPKPIGEGE